MAYRIRRILIENFKSIDHKIIDFTNKDLIVFDGPNGFGKTTIFDAIELVLCGQVSRVTNTSDGRMGYSDLLFSKDTSKDTIIKIEFENGKKRFTVIKKFDASRKLKPLDRKPDNWGLFDTYLTENLEDPLKSQNPKSAEEVYTKLEINDFNRYFSLFYYIQQEENTFFLKKNGKERMNVISQLFDTEREQAEQDKLEKIKSDLERERKKINGEGGILPNKVKLLNGLTLGLQNMDTSKLVEVGYFQLLPDLPEPKEWDKQVVSVQQDTRNLFLNELRQLYDFRKHFDEFLKAQLNKSLQSRAENVPLLQDTIIVANFLNIFGEIKVKKDKEKKLRTFRTLLTKEQVNKNFTSLPLKDLKKWIDQEVDIKAITEKISVLTGYKNNASELSAIVQEINSTRETLTLHFAKVNIYTTEDGSTCPLCGQDWKTHNKLVESIELKGEQFRKYYDLSINKFENEFNLFYIQYIEPIINWIDKYLIDERNIVDENFYNQLKESYKRKQNVQTFMEWCQLNSMDIQTFLNRKQKCVQDVESKVEEFSVFLINKKHIVKNGYTEFDERTNRFESIFQDLFDSSEEQVWDITLEQIHQKAQYIDFQYYHRSSETIKNLEIEISQLNIRLKKVESGIGKLKEIIKIYDQRIGQHWQRIMRDIEIPFYIYSGKLLQDYQRGLGLFIQESEGDGVKSIKFVASSKSDHDAVNYLSSGQVSALVIAFTLALNKVYGNNSMDILLIDDPVQTMDEINMASFVELLRNDFRHKQIFLSTHEEDVSRFIRYKFKKYGLDVLKYNVKDKFYV
ncbi:ATP-binding protein [Bacillus sp. JJ1562]|uniref:ATP-binding protein n=1 Tax=Bacillus sp. JJ1562 TaxID=3122960 RepID=UPI0030024D6E